MSKASCVKDGLQEQTRRLSSEWRTRPPGGSSRSWWQGCPLLLTDHTCCQYSRQHLLTVAAFSSLTVALLVRLIHTHLHLWCCSPPLL